MKKEEHIEILVEHTRQRIYEILCEKYVGIKTWSWKRKREMRDDLKVVAQLNLMPREGRAYEVCEWKIQGKPMYYLITGDNWSELDFNEKLYSRDYRILYQLLKKYQLDPAIDMQ